MTKFSTVQKKAVCTDKEPTKFSVRDRIKPRGLSGMFEGRIHYNEDEDIFNLAEL